jgi:hypothetical protein
MTEVGQFNYLLSCILIGQLVNWSIGQLYILYLKLTTIHYLLTTNLIGQLVNWSIGQLYILHLKLTTNSIRTNILKV